MLKVFHMADLHLGTEFSYLDKTKSKIRKNEVRLSFLAQIDNAYSKGARVFLISGDIFDSYTFSEDDFNVLKDVFNKYSECNFFLCFGNHDYLDEKRYAFFIDNMGDNVYVFGKDIGMYEFDEYRVYGVSFFDEFQKESQLENFVAISDEKLSIMVIHGDLTKVTRYNPILTSVIEESRLDYIALGHVHMYSGMNKAGNTYYCYPGTHEGKGFDELDEKGGVYLEMEKGRLNYEFLPGSIRKHTELHIDASDISLSSALINKIISEITDSKDLYKVIIQGEVSEDLIIDTDTIGGTLGEYAFFVKVYDETELKINPDDYIEENTLLGGFVREVKEKLKTEPSECKHWNKVLKKGFHLLK